MTAPQILLRRLPERIVVLHAPDKAEIPLMALMNAGNSIRLIGDVLWIGYPVEEEIGYRIVGIQCHDVVTLEIEKI